MVHILRIHGSHCVDLPKFSHIPFHSRTRFRITPIKNTQFHPQIFLTKVPSHKFCTTKSNQDVEIATKPDFWESFKKKKAEYVVKYGASFILVHELLGISSYLIVYQLLSSHILEITTFTNWFGWSEADLQAKGIDPSSKLITFAMTVVIVKGLDVMGLVPLRWALSFLITPVIARLLGPIIDPWFASARKLFAKKKQ